MVEYLLMTLDLVASFFTFHAPFPPPQPQGNVCCSHDTCEQVVDWWVAVVGWVLATLMGLAFVVLVLHLWICKIFSQPWRNQEVDA